ncbi:hypothetical protein DXG01_001542, partial [Tephrocybe rancida]
MANFNTPLPLKVLMQLFDRITLHIPVSAVAYLSQTHPMLMDKLSSHLSRSLDELLASQVSRANVDSFRTLLIRTRAVISGSTVLHFILRDNHWQPGDFDIYAPFGTGYAIVHWLVNNGGYKVVSDGSRSFIFHPHTVTAPRGPCDWRTALGSTASRISRRTNKYESTNSNIYRVYKLCSTTNTFIDVIESSKPSFLPPITRFHSTLVMNYLSPTLLVVLYPNLTFRREGVLQDRDTNTLESYDDPNEGQQAEHINTTPGVKQDYVKKYKLHGFTLFSRPSDLRKPCGAACPSLRRAVSNGVDRWALRVPLTSDVVSSVGHKRIPTDPEQNFYANIRCHRAPPTPSPRDAALHTLGQVCSSTGYVIAPLADHPQLLDLLGKILKTENNQPVRHEVVKFLGIMGALDPYRRKIRPENEASETALTAINQVPLTQHNGPAPSDDYFQSVVISAHLVILKTQGLKCVTFLPQIILAFAAVSRGPTARLGFYLKQLAILVGIVKQHVRNFMPDIFNLIRDLWENATLQLLIVNLIEALGKVLDAEFKP